MTKLGVFAACLLVLFAGAWGIGKLVGPTRSGEQPDHGHQAAPPGSDHGQAEPPGGLQIAQDGYRLELVSRALSTQAAQPLAFKVIGPDGHPVTAYTRSHEKDLHLIVVRRDLTGFQHVHPTLDSDGVWSTPIKVDDPGQYRVFADFQPAALGRGLILGADLAAPGDYRPEADRPQTREATIGDYTVTLDGELVPGTSSQLTLTITKSGVPVTDLEPYLGAFGHLVALRDGDLAYLHVHPDENGVAGPRIVFHAEVPSAGTYGLYLDFQHRGIVHTGRFTLSTDGHGHR